MSVIETARQAELDEQAFTDDWALTIVVRAQLDGPVLIEEPVADADLVDARSELWLDAFLRSGHPDLPLGAIETRLAPVETDGRCVGFALRASAPSVAAKPAVRTFGLTSVGPVAQRAAERLVGESILAPGATYVFELRSHRGAPESAAPVHGDRMMRITTEAPPLRYATIPLAPLLARARSVGDTTHDSVPVVFGESALGKAWHFARKGAADHPPIETGALLIGELSVCPDEGEMFVVVHDAIEVTDATQSEFSLIPTSGTWKQVETLVRQLGQSAGRPAMRLSGQSHGHNFALDGGPCDLCATAKECGKTTVFVSAADRTFMRTVFAAQPFALCWIAGSNARGEEVARLFTLRGGALQARGYHVVDDLPVGE